ncbi:MAG: hypothetical protein Q4F84_06815 [Fibrobacter sp.]|nr:hypothetical protein [Fibrobacter sp.]
MVLNQNTNDFIMYTPSAQAGAVVWSQAEPQYLAALTSGEPAMEPFVSSPSAAFGGTFL